MNRQLFILFIIMQSTILMSSDSTTLYQNFIQAMRSIPSDEQGNKTVGYIEETSSLIGNSPRWQGVRLTSRGAVHMSQDLHLEKVKNMSDVVVFCRYIQQTLADSQDGIVNIPLGHNTYAQFSISPGCFMIVGAICNNSGHYRSLQK